MIKMYLCAFSNLDELGYIRIICHEVILYINLLFLKNRMETNERAGNKMFEYILSAVRLYKSSLFTLILFLVIGSILLFILLFFILSNHNALVNKSSTAHNILVRCFNVLNKFLLIPYDPISTALFNVLNTLKTFLHTSNYKYQLPWTMVIGARNTGKTELLKFLKIYNPLDPIISRDQSCIWNFYNTGVVMDVSGDLVCYEEDEVLQSKENTWMNLLQILNNHRGYAPVDNVVVTFSWEDILNEKDETNIAQASYIFDKLMNVKRAFGVNVPVYIVFTKMDVIEGFAEFAAQLNEEELMEMFGWSSPYKAHTQSSRWYEEMFEALDDRLSYQVARIAADKGVATDIMSKIIIFQKQINMLKDKMMTVLAQLSHTGYDTDLFIRGVYCTGQHNDEVVFNTKLFEEKIFIERGIAEKVSPGMFATNSLLRTLQMTTVGMVIFGVADVIYQYNDVWYKVRDHKLPLANLQLALASQKYNTTVTPQVFERESQVYFAALKDAYGKHYYSWLYPVSYFTTLDDKVERALVIGCQKVILSRIHQAFQAKMEDFVKHELANNKAAHAKDQCYNNEAIAFQDLRQFVERLDQYRRIDSYIQQLPIDADLHHLKEIVHQLFDSDIYIMPTERKIYQQAMSETYIRPIIWTEYKGQLNKAFTEKADVFVKYMLKPDHACSSIKELHQDLAELSENKGDLIKLKDHLHTTITLINNMLDILNTENENEYTLGSDWREFQSTLKNVQDMLGAEDVKIFNQEVQKAFLELKNFIMTMNLPILGKVVSDNDYQQKIIGEKLYELMGLLNILAVQGIANEMHDDVNVVLNMNVQRFADAVLSIETFQELSQKQVYLMGDNRVFYEATLNAIINKMDNMLFVNQSNVTPVNSDQVQACAGYIKQLLAFLRTQKNKQAVDFLNKLHTKLMELVAENVQDAYQELSDKDFYSSSNLPLTKDGLPRGQVQEFCKIQLRQVKNVLDPIKAFLDVGQMVVDMDLHIKIDPELAELMYIQNQINNFNNNEGDVVILHNAIEKMLTSRTMLYDVYRAQWTGGPGLFAKAFERFIATTTVTCDKIKYDTYTKDYVVLSDFFNERLKNKFPFTDSQADGEAEVSDVIEFYELYDDFMKKYPAKTDAMYDIPSLKQYRDFIKAMGKCRQWLELLAKNMQTTYELVVESNMRNGDERNMQELYQWTISFDARTFDFRTAHISLPYMQCNRLENTFTLHDKSKYKFERNSDHTTVSFQGPWSIIYMIKQYSGDSSTLLVKLPLYESNQTKPTRQLAACVKFKLVQNRNEIVWYRIPVVAPDVSGI